MPARPGRGILPAMSELEVTAHGAGKHTYEVVVTNLGLEAVILSRIAGTKSESFFVGEPLHRSDLELVRGASHRFSVAPSLADGSPLEVDITFTDDSGERTKTYPVYV